MLRVRSMAWWAAGSACCVAPVIASIWTPNRDPMFWPLLVILVAITTVMGERLARGRRWLEPPVVAAATYPLGLAAGIAIELMQHGDRWAPASVTAVGGLAVAGIPLALRWLPRDPAAWFRRVAIAWIVVSIATLPLLGIGLFGIPQIVSHRLASRRLTPGQRRST